MDVPVIDEGKIRSALTKMRGTKIDATQVIVWRPNGSGVRFDGKNMEVWLYIIPGALPGKNKMLQVMQADISDI